MRVLNTVLEPSLCTIGFEVGVGATTGAAAMGAMVGGAIAEGLMNTEWDVLERSTLTT